MHLFLMLSRQGSSPQCAVGTAQPNLTGVLDWIVAAVVCGDERRALPAKMHPSCRLSVSQCLSSYSRTRVCHTAPKLQKQNRILSDAYLQEGGSVNSPAAVHFACVCCCVQEVHGPC